MLHDLFIESLQAIEVTGAITSQFLCPAEAMSNGLHHKGNGEKEQAQYPRREEGAAVEHVVEH